MLGFPFDTIIYATFLQHLLGRSTVDLLGTSTNTMICRREQHKFQLFACGDYSVLGEADII